MAALSDYVVDEDYGAEEVDPCKLCILGLPWDTSQEDLYAYFSRFGSLREATIIRKTKTGESRGFGFVTYVNAADAEAVRAQEHSVGGRHCDAKQALPRGSANPSRTTRLFIGRMPPSVTDEVLRGYFTQFGPVQDAYVPKDPNTGKQAHRGFGFVTFASAEDVDKVMACAHTLHGQELAVQCAIPKMQELPVLRSGPKWSGSSGSLGSFPSSVASSLSSGSVPSYMAYNTASPGAMSGYGASAFSVPGANLYNGFPAELAGPGRSANGGSPGGMYRGMGGPPPPPPRFYGGPNGEAMAPQNGLDGYAGPGPQALDGGQDGATLMQGYGGASPPGVEATVQALQGLTIPGSSEGIGYGLALLQQAGPGRPGGPGMESRNAPLGPGSPTAGLDYSPQSPSGMGRMGTPNGLHRKGSLRSNGGSSGGFSPVHSEAFAGPRIFVGKLNKDTSEHDVKEYFTKYGYVIDVYMPRDKVKRTEHRGFGFVTFETEASIQRIAAHHPHHIKGSVVAIDSAVPRREVAPPPPFSPYGGSPPPEGSSPFHLGRPVGNTLPHFGGGINGAPLSSAGSTGLPSLFATKSLPSIDEAQSLSAGSLGSLGANGNISAGRHAQQGGSNGHYASELLSPASSGFPNGILSPSGGSYRGGMGSPGSMSHEGGSPCYPEVPPLDLSGAADLDVHGSSARSLEGLHEFKAF